MKIKVTATNGTPCKCSVQELFEWLLEEIRIKVQAVPIGAGEGQIPGPTASGHASEVEVVRIPLNSGKDLTTFLGRYSANPHRRFLFSFPKMRLAGEVYLHANIPRSKKPRLEASPWTIMFPSGSYEAIAGHLEAMLAEIKAQDVHGDDDAAEARAIFGDLLRLLKGKYTGPYGLDYLDQKPKLLNRGLSFVVSMAGSEGARCFGMLAASMMALNLLKYGFSDADIMFRQGGWPAVGAETEEALRQIDNYYYEVSQPLHPLPQPLSAKAKDVEIRFQGLLKVFCEKSLERDRDHVPRGRVAWQPRHWGFTDDAALLLELKALLTRKVLNHI
jgi:hypothetical protein